MTTKFVSIKEFRQNIATFANLAQSNAGTERLIVMNRSTPLFEVKPFARNTKLDKLVADIAAAEEDIKHGRLHSHQDVLEALGFNE